MVVNVNSTRATPKESHTMTTITVQIGNLRTALTAIRNHVPGGTAKKNQASRAIALTPDSITHTGPLDVPAEIHITVPLHGTGDTTEPIYVDATAFNKAVTAIIGRGTKKNNEANMVIELDGNTVCLSAPEINNRTATIDVTEHHHPYTLDTVKVDDEPLIITQAGELAHVWNTTHKSLSTDTTLSVLTMFQVGVVGKQVTFAATDRYRMSLAQPDVKYCTLADNKGISLPSALVKATTHIHADATIKIYANSHLTWFILDDGDGTRVIARTSGDRSVSPDSLHRIATGKTHDSVAYPVVSTTPDTNEVATFIKELTSVRTTGNVTLYPSATSIHAEVRGNHPVDTIYGEDTLGVDWDNGINGQEGSPVRLHNNYLMDTLSMISTDKVNVVIRGEMSPVLIHEVGGKVQHAIMPIRM